MRFISIGSFGRVKLARNKITNKWVALKILKKAEIIRLKQVDHVINENTLLSNIDHPFIVKKKCVWHFHLYYLICKVSMDGFCQDDRYLYLILEYVSGGELFTYLRSVGRLESPHAWFDPNFFSF